MTAVGVTLVPVSGALANPDPSQGIFDVVNAETGVFWRNSPSWSDTNRVPGEGVYNGDEVSIECWGWGDSVGPWGNKLWYLVVDLSRGPDADGNYQEGWVNDHFLDTPGTAADPQPYGLPCS